MEPPLEQGTQFPKPLSHRPTHHPSQPARAGELGERSGIFELQPLRDAPLLGSRSVGASRTPGQNLMRSLNGALLSQQRVGRSSSGLRRDTSPSLKHMKLDWQICKAGHVLRQELPVLLVDTNQDSPAWIDDAVSSFRFGSTLAKACLVIIIVVPPSPSPSRPRETIERTVLPEVCWKPGL